MVISNKDIIGPDGQVYPAGFDWRFHRGRVIDISRDDHGFEVSCLIDGLRVMKWRQTTVVFEDSEPAKIYDDAVNAILSKIPVCKDIFIVTRFSDGAELLVALGRVAINNDIFKAKIRALGVLRNQYFTD